MTDYANEWMILQDQLEDGFKLSCIWHRKKMGLYIGYGFEDEDCEEQPCNDSCPFKEVKQSEVK
jgi:hypothetical protein